ncbi:nuclear transport factor 2 family protein [Kribbella qitaiheensis]|uniref:nuclear transport factor 2 family protein n=1 Tax=Kribbella qitaiheensis TaxID=1544730 RepID=UPI003607BC09
MTGTEQTRAVVRLYFETMSERDWGEFGRLLIEDVVYEMPQTSERITGREKYVAFNREYPGDWRLTVTRLLADGATAAASMNFTVGDEELVGLVYFELRGELIARITDFWPEPYAPPAGREHLVEFGVTGLDRLSGS